MISSPLYDATGVNIGGFLRTITLFSYRQYDIICQDKRLQIELGHILGIQEFGSNIGFCIIYMN